VLRHGLTRNGKQLALRLHGQEFLEASLVGDEQRCPVHLNQFLALEDGEKPGDGLARGTDHLRDLLVGESQSSAVVAVLSALGGKVKQEARQFFLGRSGQPQVSCGRGDESHA
jgi:hypothetical protein